MLNIKSSNRSLFSAVLIVAIVSSVALVGYKFSNSHNQKEELTAVDSLMLPFEYAPLVDPDTLSLADNKRKFIKELLPGILKAKAEIDKEHSFIKYISEQIETGEQMAATDSLHITALMAEFKARDLEELEVKLRTHPVSIVLAQAAIESGWGTSRFYKEANNVFGIWSYSQKEKRIAAGKTRDGKTIYVRKYSNVSESIHDYYKVIARANAYNELREKRMESNNPYELIWYLDKYSEKRFEYVVMLRNMITQNQFTMFDRYERRNVLLTKAE